MSRIKVSHDLGDLSSKEDRILVMKDKSILEDSDDDAVAMEDVDIAEREKREQNQRRAQHGRKYNPYEYDWDHTDTMLSKYDDFDALERERRLRSTKELVVGQSLNLSSSSAPHSKDEGYNPQEEFPATVTLASSSRAYNTTKPVLDESLRFQSDFYTSAEAASFKKVTKKDKKKKRSRDNDEEDQPPSGKVVQLIASAEEDEELYSQLARLRRIDREKISFNNEDIVAQTALSTRTNSQDQQSASVSDFLARIDRAREEPEEEAPQTGDQEMESPTEPTIEPQIPTMGASVVEPEELIPTESAQVESKSESISQDVKVDSGLACALKFFQSRGDIETDHSNEARIEYRDDFGRPLDAKEAFQHMSRKFHGKKLNSEQYHKQAKKHKADVASKKIYN